MAISLAHHGSPWSAALAAVDRATLRQEEKGPDIAAAEVAGLRQELSVCEAAADLLGQVSDLIREGGDLAPIRQTIEAEAMRGKIYQR